MDIVFIYCLIDMYGEIMDKEKGIINLLRNKINLQRQQIDKMKAEAIGWKRRMKEQSQIIDKLRSEKD